MLPHYFKRRHNTCLTDSELILFDAIFDCAYPLRLLKDDSFQEVFNMNYSHGFNDKTLIECLNNLVINGLLFLDGVTEEVLCVSHLYESFNTSISIQLTEKGGELWELERDPDWNLYCIDSEDEERFYVSSPSLETAQRFFETAHECHFSSFAINERTIERVQEEQLIPWKQFDSVYSLSAPLTHTSYDMSETNWTLYEERRMWWRFVEELLTLSPMST